MIAGAGNLPREEALEGADELVSCETHHSRDGCAVFAQDRPESASVPVRAAAVPWPLVDRVEDSVPRHVVQPDAAFEQGLFTFKVKPSRIVKGANFFEVTMPMAATLNDFAVKVEYP